MVGEMLHYGIVFLFVGGAFLWFVWRWWRGNLDFGEEAKYQMFEDEDERERR